MNIDKLKEKINKYNIEYSEENIEKLAKFNDLMLEYNKIHNLTSITEENDVIIKHFIDSLLPYKELEENKKIIDIGCGGGFPSVPLAIINEKLNILAVDSIKKKTDFVLSAKNTLNIANLEVKTTRIEDIAFKTEYRESFDIVISRAVASLNTIIEYSAPLLKKHGKIVAYKGSNYQEELDNAKNALNLLKCRVKTIKEYYIEEIDTYRYIIIVEKFDDINKKYPRKQNKPRLQPL